DDDVVKDVQVVETLQSRREQLFGPVGQRKERYAGRVQLNQNLDGVLDRSDERVGEVLTVSTDGGLPVRVRCNRCLFTLVPRAAGVLLVVPGREVELLVGQEARCLLRPNSLGDGWVRVPGDQDIAEVED